MNRILLFCALLLSTWMPAALRAQTVTPTYIFTNTFGPIRIAWVVVTPLVPEFVNGTWTGTRPNNFPSYLNPSLTNGLLTITNTLANGYSYRVQWNDGYNTHSVTDLFPTTVSGPVLGFNYNGIYLNGPAMAGGLFAYFSPVVTNFQSSAPVLTNTDGTVFITASTNANGVIVYNVESTGVGGLTPNVATTNNTATQIYSGPQAFTNAQNSFTGSFFNPVVTNAAGNTATLHLAGNAGTGGVDNPIISTPAGLTVGKLNLTGTLNLGSGGIHGNGSGLTGMTAAQVGADAAGSAATYANNATNGFAVLILSGDNFFSGDNDFTAGMTHLGETFMSSGDVHYSTTSHIVDHFGVNAIQTDGRLLQDGQGNPSVDWNNYILSSGGAGDMIDGGIDWSNCQLTVQGSTTLDWNSNKLHGFWTLNNAHIVTNGDTAELSLANVSILKGTADGSGSGDNFILVDKNGLDSIHPNTRGLWDSAGGFSVLWNNRALVNASGLNILDWQNQIIRNAATSGTVFDWGNLNLVGNWTLNGVALGTGGAVPNGLVTNNAAGVLTNISGILAENYVNVTNLGSGNGTVILPTGISTPSVNIAGATSTVTYTNKVLGFTNPVSGFAMTLPSNSPSFITPTNFPGIGWVWRVTGSNGSSAWMPDMTNLQTIISTNIGIYSLFTQTNTGVPGGTILTLSFLTVASNALALPQIQMFGYSDGNGGFTNITTSFNVSTNVAPWCWTNKTFNAIGMTTGNGQTYTNNFPGRGELAIIGTITLATGALSSLVLYSNLTSHEGDVFNPSCGSGQANSIPVYDSLLVNPGDVLIITNIGLGNFALTRSRLKF